MHQKLNALSNILMAVFVWACALAVCCAACLLLYSVVAAGVTQVNLSFLTQEPMDSGRAGGIAPIILSTVLIIGVCLLATIPLGVGTAIFLADNDLGKSKLANGIRTALDVLGGVPFNARLHGAADLRSRGRVRNSQRRCRPLPSGDGTGTE